MIKGFVFNNKHSFNDMGIVMKSKNRPILPEPRIIAEEILCRDGEYDFSEANPDGRTKYKPLPIEVECSCLRKDMAYLRIKAHEIASWLACGEKQLIFDDETAVYYLARISNKLDLATEIGRIGRFTLQFKCRPFGFSRVRSDQALQLGMGLMLGYGYRLDMSPTTFVVAGAAAYSVYNPGTYVKPLIRISGSCSTISFTANGKTITYGAALSGGQLDIDCEKQTAIKNSTTNAMSDVTGKFIELVNGSNSLQISGTGLNCTVTLIFNYLYL
jgi:predicted phage tail component-like protein